MVDNKQNIKDQIILLIWALAQTAIWACSILFFVYCLKMLIFTPEEIDNAGLQFVANTVCLNLPLLALVYIPTMLFVKEKGRLNGLTTVDSVYFNPNNQRVRLKTFSDYAEFKPKIVVLFFALGPIAFLLQLTALVFAIIATKSSRIVSKVGLVDYSELENEKWQRTTQLLFNFTTLPKKKEESPSVEE